MNSARLPLVDRLSLDPRLIERFTLATEALSDALLEEMIQGNRAYRGDWRRDVDPSFDDLRGAIEVARRRLDLVLLGLPEERVGILSAL